MKTPPDMARLLDEAQSSGDFGALVAAIPFAQFIGLTVVRGADDELLAKMPFQPHLIGNSMIPALHGGTLGGLLESAAIFGLLWESRKEPILVRGLKIVNITVEYLRTARTVDTFAHAEITRQGRRVATVRSFAWQEDRAQPVAVANAHFLLPTK